MPSDSTKILEFNQYQKPDRAPFVTYAYLECLTEKIDGCKNNTENPPQQKYEYIFHQIFQCLQYRHLKVQKISMMYTGVKTV